MARRQTQRSVYAQLLARFDREIAEAFVLAIAEARAAVDMAALAQAIDAGDLMRAGQLLRMDDATLFRVTEAVRGGYIAAGQSVAQVAPGGVGVFAFDGRHLRAEAWVRQHAGTLVQSIADDTLPILRSVVQDGLERGRGGAAVARDITGRLNRLTGRREGGFLGLTSQQTDAAIRARAQLTNLDKSYFTRQLRDRRYDAMVRQAIESGKPLSAADIERITMRYRDRMAKYRGEMIARNEAHTALAQGQREGWQQMIDSGKVKDVLKSWQWNAGSQKEPRQDHQAMSSMPGIPFDQPFTMADGAQMMHPHDPAGGPQHSIGCRCTVMYRPILPEA